MGPKHVEIRQYINKIEIVTSVAFIPYNHNSVLELTVLTNVTLASSNSALPDDGDYTETCWNCFNVNFNTPFQAILLCISW